MTLSVDAELQARFREVMAGVPTPVSVITSMGDGLPHGTTVSAFASLSMTPPMVLVSLDRDEQLLCVWEAAAGKRLYRLDLSDHGLNPGVLLSPDSRWLVIFGNGHPWKGSCEIPTSPGGGMDCRCHSG